MGVADTKRPSKVELWNERRRARHEQARTLHRQGGSIQAISRELRMDRRTVRTTSKVETCPEARGRRKGNPGSTVIWSTVPEMGRGVSDSAQLYREIRSKGYRGSGSSVRHFVARWRAALPDGLKRARTGPTCGA